MKALYDATGAATTAGPSTQESKDQSEQGGEDKKRMPKEIRSRALASAFAAVSYTQGSKDQGEHQGEDEQENA